jgi:hypothetical protein
VVAVVGIGVLVLVLLVLVQDIGDVYFILDAVLVRVDVDIQEHLMDGWIPAHRVVSQSYVHFRVRV